MVRELALHPTPLVCGVRFAFDCDLLSVICNLLSPVLLSRFSFFSFIGSLAPLSSLLSGLLHSNRNPVYNSYVRGVFFR